MMARRGTNYNARMAEAARQEAYGRLALPSFQPQSTSEHGSCCGHLASEHGDAGCYHGWGNPAEMMTGCICPVPGMADRD